MSIRVSQEDVDCVFETQSRFHPKEKLSKKKKDLIKQRLKDGYTIPDLVRAIIGCHNTPHNLGENDRGTKYLGLHVSICSENVDRFLEAGDEALELEERQAESKRKRDAKRQLANWSKKDEPAESVEDSLAEFRKMRREAGI
tara:strand:- start:654 stop:1079 length:426 start_codon:yes stop_codon:yes gene_type:complete